MGLNFSKHWIVKGKVSPDLSAFYILRCVCLIRVFVVIVGIWVHRFSLLDSIGIIQAGVKVFRSYGCFTLVKLLHLKKRKGCWIKQRKPYPPPSNHTECLLMPTLKGVGWQLFSLPTVPIPWHPWAFGCRNRKSLFMMDGWVDGCLLLPGNQGKEQNLHPTSFFDFVLGVAGMDLWTGRNG